MSYDRVSPQRTEQIRKVLNHPEPNPDYEGLAQLLKLDTSSPHFLEDFRRLKNEKSYDGTLKYPIIKMLCDPKGFFGRIGYAFTGDKYRSGRYKTILQQLKNGQDANGMSFFVQQDKEESSPKLSFCRAIFREIRAIENKVYDTIPEAKMAESLRNELLIFNENVGYRPDTDNYEFIDRTLTASFKTPRNEFLDICKAQLFNTYFILEDPTKFNYKGEPLYELHEEFIKKMNLTENELPIFIDYNNDPLKDTKYNEVGINKIVWDKVMSYKIQFK